MQVDLAVGLGILGAGIGLLGIAIIKSLNTGYRAGTAETNLEKAMGENLATRKEFEDAQADIQRRHEEHEVYKTKVAAALESGDWNSVLKDAPSLDDLTSGPNTEDTTHAEYVQGVLPVHKRESKD